MNHRFLLVPAAIVMAAAPVAKADQLQSLEEAQQRLFPSAALTPFELRLSSERFARLKAEYQVPALRPLFRGWSVAGGGWLYLDQVYGLNDIVTYLVAIGVDGKSRGIEVLTCADGYCDIYTSEWRAKLAGLAHGRWDPDRAVPIVSDATLSPVHVAEGVKKILAVHAQFHTGY